MLNIPSTEKTENVVNNPWLEFIKVLFDTCKVREMPTKYRILVLLIGFCFVIGIVFLFFGFRKEGKWALILVFGFCFFAGIWKYITNEIIKWNKN